MAGTLIGMSLRNMNSSKNRIIAINIAREEIEAMRNIRDTNWLKFSTLRRECWNNFPAQDYLATCDGNNPIVPGNYIIYKQGDDDGIDGIVEDTFRFRLQKIGNLLPLGDQLPNPPPAPIPDQIYYNTTSGNTFYWNNSQSKWEDLTKIYLVDVDLDVDTDGDRNLTNDTDAYNHIYTENDDALGRLNSRKTVFNRFITIEYLKNSSTAVSSKTAWDTEVGAGQESNLNRMRVTAHVSWQAGKNRFSTKLITHLTDYLGRENLNN